MRTRLTNCSALIGLMLPTFKCIYTTSYRTIQPVWILKLFRVYYLRLIVDRWSVIGDPASNANKCSQANVISRHFRRDAYSPKEDSNRESPLFVPFKQRGSWASLRLVGRKCDDECDDALCHTGTVIIITTTPTATTLHLVLAACSSIPDIGVCRPFSTYSLYIDRVQFIA